MSSDRDSVAKTFHKKIKYGGNNQLKSQNFYVELTSLFGNR